MGAQFSKSLELFYSEFLNANTWAQRKDGVPLELLDNLSLEELNIAESELINVVSINDTWPILGLGHIRSTAALPKLYELLTKGSKYIRIILAHSIFLICKDQEMIEIAIIETNQLAKKLPKTEFELVNVIYWLPDFKDERIGRILSDFCNNSSYLVAYNAARVLGRSKKDTI